MLSKMPHMKATGQENPARIHHKRMAASMHLGTCTTNNWKAIKEDSQTRARKVS